MTDTATAHCISPISVMSSCFSFSIMLIAKEVTGEAGAALPC